MPANPLRSLRKITNNAPNTREINIPVENTPLETAYQLQTLLGNTSAELVSGKVRLSLPSQTLAVFSVR
jgi:hypothetical protein